jgi:hypothetical protein
MSLAPEESLLRVDHGLPGEWIRASFSHCYLAGRSVIVADSEYFRSHVNQKAVSCTRKCTPQQKNPPNPWISGVFIGGEWGIHPADVSWGDIDVTFNASSCPKRSITTKA